MASIFANQEEIMKKTVLFLIALATISVVFAQKTKSKKDYTKILSRPGDHIMIQLTSDHWIGTPDSIKSRMTGISRGANFYIMLDKPFKNNPQMSVAFGVGIGTSNIYFKNTNVDIKSTSTMLPFTNLDSTNHFKAYKLTTAYLEAPIELRFSADPENDGKSFKAALGIKVGTILNAHTKGKTLLTKSGSTLDSYTEKESSKHFFNSTRLAATARIGYGKLSLFGSYQINSIFKDGVAPNTQLLQVGLCISGL